MSFFCHQAREGEGNELIIEDEIDSLKLRQNGYKESMGQRLTVTVTRSSRLNVFAFVTKVTADDGRHFPSLGFPRMSTEKSQSTEDGWILPPHLEDLPDKE
jgi:hypothetical protein